VSTKSLEIDPDHPELHLLQQAVDVILQGGMIAFPTDTTYGLGVNPFDDEAVQRVYTVKHRAPDKPLIILINESQQIEQLTTGISTNAQRLIERFWPGPLTLIFKTTPELLKFKIGSSGKIGVRLPHSLIAQHLIGLAKIPITASSANLSGQPSSLNAAQVRRYFGDQVDIIVDGGPAPGLYESTVLDVTYDPPRLIREGAIRLTELNQICVISRD